MMSGNAIPRLISQGNTLTCIQWKIGPSSIASSFSLCGSLYLVGALCRIFLPRFLMHMQKGDCYSQFQNNLRYSSFPSIIKKMTALIRVQVPAVTQVSIILTIHVHNVHPKPPQRLIPSAWFNTSIVWINEIQNIPLFNII